MEAQLSFAESGKRVGECHQRAKLSNAEVELIRKLNEQGMTYRELAQKFEVNYWYIGRLCRYERRATSAVRVKKAMKSLTQEAF